MKKYYDKMKKEIRSLVIGGIVCIIVAVIMFAAGNEDAFGYLSASRDLFDATDSTIQEGEWYQVNTDYLLDYYASDDDGRYYVGAMMTDEDSDSLTFMGFYFYDEDCATADEIVSEYWSLIDSDDYPETWISGTGYIYNMSDSESAYFREWFEAMGADEDMINNLCYKTIIVVPESVIADSIFSNGFTWVALVLLVIGLLLLLIPLNTYKKQVMETIIKNRFDEDEIAADLDAGVSLGKLDIGQKYAIIYGEKSSLIELDKLVWAYTHITKTEHKVYGVIPAGTTTVTALKLISRDGTIITAPIKNETIAKSILEELSKHADHALIGYDERLAQLMNSNFKMLVEISDKRRAQFEAMRNPQPEESQDAIETTEESTETTETIETTENTETADTTSVIENVTPLEPVVPETPSVETPVFSGSSYNENKDGE